MSISKSFLAKRKLKLLNISIRNRFSVFFSCQTKKAAFRRLLRSGFADEIDPAGSSAKLVAHGAVVHPKVDGFSLHAHVLGCGKALLILPGEVLIAHVHLAAELDDRLIHRNGTPTGLDAQGGLLVAEGSGGHEPGLFVLISLAPHRGHGTGAVSVFGDGDGTLLPAKSGCAAQVGAGGRGRGRGGRRR